MRSVDPEALEDVVGRWSRPRLPLARARAADGKRIRGANLDDEGGELAATQDLLGRSDIGGKVITLDALHTVRSTARRVTERCGAESVFTVKVHGRLERRSTSVLTPPKGLVNDPGISQIARPRAAEEGSRRRREGRGGPHGNRLPHHLPRRGRRGAGGTAPPEPRPPGGGKPEPSPERLRLRRGRLHGPQGQRSGKPSLNTIARAESLASRREAIAALTRP